ncbi:hypothetical protein SALIVB_0060 [Streptococcus salivarius CCHSS3]|uniref:hypothetical protein n=1 Tax=Streptococcus salivarius TaxID=1304 RepID=UPI0002145F85|nr:hypothetical protein [Streptococcus salivarius]CCB92406.1 hypothetical protein SALIVB_0060 [Streptococcus salivarius CCHSS3]
MDYITFRTKLFKYLDVQIDTPDDKIYFKVENSIYKDDELLVFDNKEIEKLFSLLPEYKQEENYFLESSTSFELFLTSSDVRRPPRYSYSSINVEDNTSKINYCISKISDVSTFYLLYKRIEEIVYPGYDILMYFKDMDIRKKRVRRLEQVEFEQDKSYESFLGYLSNQIIPYYFSLKIISNEPKTIDEFKRYKDSFIFTYIYSKHRPIIEADNLNKISDERRFLGVGSLEMEAPKRTYDPFIIEYYRQASESSDPFIQFISYYHILEYFFDEIFNKKLIDDLMDKITHPDFSYRDESKIKELAEFSHKRLKGFGEDGQGNELESLKFVLKEYVRPIELRERLIELKQDPDYYQNNRVSFSNGPGVSFSDENGIYTTLAKRIYFTRNSLIHSKSNRASQTYRVNIHKDILKNEIPLLEAVSELVILSSSKIL